MERVPKPDAEASVILRENLRHVIVRDKLSLMEFSEYYMETLLYLRSLLASENSLPAPKLPHMQQVQAIMEKRLVGALSEDPVVRAAQELLYCEHISHYLAGVSHDVKSELAVLLQFFSQVSQESGDLEFSLSLEVIVESLLKPT